MGLDRKRKSISSLQNSDKKRKSIVVKKSSSEDSDEQSDHDNGLNDVVQSDIPVINRWPQEDIQKLLSQIELALPKNDNNTYKSRIPKLDWDKIQFEKYSKDECLSTWLAIQDQLRTFKTLGDLVQDAKHLLATKGIDTYQSKQNRLQKPKTAYMLYYMEVLQKYKKKHPDLSLPQLTKLIAEKYKNLSPEKKQTYIDQAQKLKTDYLELIDKNNIGFKPKSESIAKPKTPFQIFVESQSADSQLDKAELQIHLKEKWENMSEKKKSKWIKLAKEREQAYLSDLIENHKNDPAFILPTKSALTKSDREILDSQSGKPKKPPVNNYSLFSKEMLQSDEMNNIPPKEKMAAIAQKWKAFSNEERQIYADKLKVITERYWTEYDAYLKTLPEDERQKELATNKSKPKKAEPKVVPRINAREGIPEKPKKVPVKKTKEKEFENEPAPILYKNAFELYKSKNLTNEKRPFTSLEDWVNRSGPKQAIYESEFKTIKKEYMKKLKVFLKSLSESELTLYLKLRKPELVADNQSASDSSDSENSSDDDDDDEEDQEEEEDNDSDSDSDSE